MNLAALSLIALAIAVPLSCTTKINVGLLATLSAQINSPVTFLTHAQAAPVFAALEQSPPVARDWDGWIAGSDAATRARVAPGDESSIVNLLLLGTSLTAPPRIHARQPHQDQIQKT